MDKEKKSRSGSQSNRNEKNENVGDRGRKQVPGTPVSSNRTTGGNKRQKRDHSFRGAERNTTKRGSNSV
jgi:hypothetical protein